MSANPHRRLPLSKKARPSVPDMRGRKVCLPLEPNHLGQYDATVLLRHLGYFSPAAKTVDAETIKNWIQGLRDSPGKVDTRELRWTEQWKRGDPRHPQLTFTWTEPTRRLSPKNLEYLRSRGVRLPCQTTPKT